MTTCCQFSEIPIKINKMAIIAITIGRALINRTALVSGSYLAKYLSGDQNSVEDRERHKVAAERYQVAYKKYQENRKKLLDWIKLMTESRSRQNRICWTKVMLRSYTTRCIIKRLISENHSFLQFIKLIFFSFSITGF